VKVVDCTFTYHMFRPIVFACVFAVGVTGKCNDEGECSTPMEPVQASAMLQVASTHQAQRNYDGVRGQRHASFHIASAYEDNNCYVDETHAATVDSRCISEAAPSDSVNGQWYRMPADWHSGRCDDSNCIVRCRGDGVAFHSDYGTEYKTNGDAIECVRKRLRYHDSICYTNETYSATVDDTCVSEAPSDSVNGQWYRMPADWHDGVCDDSNCIIRCRDNGVAFNSDYGTEYNTNGDTIECVRRHSQYHDSICYIDETYSASVDSRCVSEAPSDSVNGEWYRMPAAWHDGVCDDSTCKFRCRENGVAANSDYGPERGNGDTIECVRKPW